MKQFLWSCLIFPFLLGAQDSTITLAADTVNYKPVVDIQAVSFKPERFQRFYIGFSNDSNGMEMFTLQIKQITSQDSLYKFNYILNTRKNRYSGDGEIMPQQSLIRFDNMDEGRISLPDDGKLVFESSKFDSLNYWKLKEK